MATEWLDEDFVTLQDVLNELTQNDHLKALLSAFCMCYGVKPSEISFANHSRMCQLFYESVARVQDGGEAFIQAFKERLAEQGVQIQCNSHIVECADIRNDHAHRFVLDDGEEISFDNCLFTIHPKEVLKILPSELLSRAFKNRIEDFEPSAGFFCVFGATEPNVADETLGDSIVSLFPSTDVNEMLDPMANGDSALVVMRSPEAYENKEYSAVSAFEPSFFEEVSEWKDSRSGKRPQSYLDYKEARARRIMERLQILVPEEQFRLIDTASVLTFKDYLHTPDGSAYGIKQKVGQFNLFGKIPVRNMYVAGQSSILPGVLGAMMSSFIVVRAILGKDSFGRFIREGMSS